MEQVLRSEAPCSAQSMRALIGEKPCLGDGIQQVPSGARDGVQPLGGALQQRANCQAKP